MKTYNHAFTLAFAVRGSSDPDGNETAATVRAALLQRIVDLPDDELLEACGAPFDTFEEEEVHTNVPKY